MNTTPKTFVKQVRYAHYRCKCSENVASDKNSWRNVGRSLSGIARSGMH